MEHEPRTAALPADTGSQVKPDRLLLLRTMLEHGGHNQIVYNLRNPICDHLRLFSKCNEPLIYGRTVSEDLPSGIVVIS